MYYCYYRCWCVRLTCLEDSSGEIGRHGGWCDYMSTVRLICLEDSSGEIGRQGGWCDYMSTVRLICLEDSWGEIARHGGWCDYMSTLNTQRASSGSGLCSGDFWTRSITQSCLTKLPTWRETVMAEMEEMALSCNEAQKV